MKRVRDRLSYLGLFILHWDPCFFLLIVKHSNHHANYLLILTDLKQTIHLQPTQDGNLFVQIKHVDTIGIVMT